MFISGKQICDFFLNRIFKFDQMHTVKTINYLITNLSAYDKAMKAFCVV